MRRFHELERHIPAGVRVDDVETSVLRHLLSVKRSAMSKADCEFECTLTSIALYARCTQQYVGRLMAGKLIPAGLVTRRIAESGLEGEGRYHLRKGTAVYILTKEGEGRVKALPPEKLQRKKAAKDPTYGRRWSDSSLNAAWQAERQGLYDSAERIYKRALSSGGGAVKRAWIVTRLAAIDYCRSDFKGALRLLSQAEELQRREKGSLIATDCAIVRAVCYISLFRTAEAARLLRPAAREYARHGDLLGEGVAKHNLGFSLAYDGRTTEAVEEFRAALGLFERAGEREWIAIACLTLASQLNKMSESKEAMAFAERALDMAAELKNDLTKSRALTSKGEILQATGDSKAAEVCFRRALSVALPLNDRRAIVDNVVWLTRLAALSGDLQLAGKCLDRLATLAAHPDFKPTKRWMETGALR
jgi:tetratricopeptide (TPR) repeat protein